MSEFFTRRDKKVKQQTLGEFLQTKSVPFQPKPKPQKETKKPLITDFMLKQLANTPKEKVDIFNDYYQIYTEKNHPKKRNLIDSLENEEQIKNNVYLKRTKMNTASQMKYNSKTVFNNKGVEMIDLTQLKDKGNKLEKLEKQRKEEEQLKKSKKAEEKKKKAEFEQNRLQLLKENSKRQSLLDLNLNKKNFSIGDNLLVEYNHVDILENQKVTKIQTNQFMESLLKSPFDLKIDEDNELEKILPNEYSGFTDYLVKNSTVLLDEIRSQFKCSIRSEEFLARRNFKVEFLYVSSVDENEAIYKLLIPEKYSDDISYTELYSELEKGVPLLYVKLKNKDKKSQTFLGLRVKREKNDSNDFFFRFNKTFKSLSFHQFIKVPARCTFFSDFTSSLRELKALVKMGNSSFNIFHRTFNKKTARSLINENEEEMSDFGISSKVNSSQKEAIKFLCNSSKSIGLLQGPPGTGKSFTLIELVRFILNNDKSKKQILICTPSNCALDELVSRFIGSFELYDFIDDKNPVNGKKDILQILRVGKCSDTTSDKVLKKTLDNIIKIRYKSDNIQQMKEEFKIFVEEIKELTAKKSKDKKDKKRMEELKKLIEERRTLKSFNTNDIKKNIINNSKIIFTTLNSSAKKQLKIIKNNISYLIVDEATQASELQTLTPLCLNPDRVILIGDPKQLPATTFHPSSKSLNLRRSLFERLQTLDFKVHMLKIQYRMTPSICQFSSDNFYNSNLITASKAADKNYINKKVSSFLDKEFNGKSFNFVDVVGRTSERNSSFFNSEEARAIIHYIDKLKERGISNFGIITPYKQQLRFLKRKLFDKYGNDDIPINTVDGFQGKENDIIFLSCVKSLNSSGGKMGIGFLKDERRLNVAVTRAKFSLIVVGNIKTLNRNSLWNKMITYTKESGCVVNYSDRNGEIDLEEGEVDSNRVKKKRKKNKREKEKHKFKDEPYKIKKIRKMNKIDREEKRDKKRRKNRTKDKDERDRTKEDKKEKKSKDREFDNDYQSSLKDKFNGLLSSAFDNKNDKYKIKRVKIEKKEFDLDWIERRKEKPKKKESNKEKTFYDYGRKLQSKRR